MPEISPQQLVRLDQKLRPAALARLRSTMTVQATETEPAISHLLKIVGRHKLLLATFVVVAMGAGTALCLIMPKMYEGTAQVEIDRRSAMEGLNQIDGPSSSVSDMDQIVTTQLELVQSDSVLRPVVKKYNLLAQEKQLSNFFGLPLKPEEVKAIESGPIDLKHLIVKRPPNSYLINISYRADSPQLAAAVANDLANTYVDYQGRLRAQDTTVMRATMMQQKAQLEKSIGDSTAQLAELTREINVLEPEDGVTLLSNRLESLESAYTAAETERTRRQAEAEVVKSGSMAAAQMSTQGDALNKLLDRRNDLLQRLADIKTTYGDNYPEYQRVANSLAEANRQILDLRAEITQRTDKAYQQGAQQEALIKSALDTAKADFEGLASRRTEYDKLKQRVEDDRKRYDDLVQRIRDADINVGYEKGVARMASPAQIPYMVAFPKVPLVLAASFLLAIVMGLGSVVLIDAVEGRVSGAETAARHMNVNLMAKLPVIKRQMTLARFAQADLSPAEEKAVKSLQWFHESVRTLINTLVLSIDLEQTRNLLLTSCAPGEGKSTIAGHLALASASMRRKTLLIDADMRRGVAHRLFQIPLVGGLSSVLEGQMKWQDAAVPIPGQCNLHVMPAGRLSQLAMEQHGLVMPGILAEAGREYDLVLIDAPPFALAESVQLATIADGVVVVAHADKTSASAASSLIDKLQSLNINIVGMVLNHAKDGTLGSYYNQYGYGYGYGAKPAVRRAKA